jgi:N4-gp56 family major capsid protein
MANEYTSGAIWSSTLPSWQRDYYSMLLLETLRTKSIMVPYCTVKQDFAAANSGVVIYSEVMDTDPNYNPLTETDIWLKGAHLDSRTVRIELGIYGDTLKFSDYGEVVQYINAGNMRGLVSEKIGQNQVDMLDILARNAFLASPFKTFAGSKANRAALAATDLFNADLSETIRVHLEENDIPGVMAVEDGASAVIVCTTTPRVIKDIRTGAGSKWLELQEYAGGSRKFNSEVGSWSGIRFVKSNRLRLRNHGAVEHQTHLHAAIVPGAGAAATVDSVYTVGQTGSTRFITVADTTNFTVGRYITVHAAGAGLGAGNPPVETDGTQETRRIVEVTDGTKLVVNKPFFKDHAIDDLVTLGVDIQTSIFHGGPSVVYAIGEAPNVVVPPKYDDLMMVNRYGWRGFLKFQQFRPEFLEVVESGGSTD